jgi:hypothetical protein
MRSFLVVTLPDPSTALTLTTAVTRRLRRRLRAARERMLARSANLNSTRRPPGTRLRTVRSRSVRAAPGTDTDALRRAATHSFGRNATTSRRERRCCFFFAASRSRGLTVSRGFGAGWV